MKIDLTWPAPLSYKAGSATRLCGIDVFYDFDWEGFFGHGRSQFPNGTSLASLVRDKCPSGKRPALLLTFRDGEEQGFRQTKQFFVGVINIEEYCEQAKSSAALTYFAEHLDIDIADIDELRSIIQRADQQIVRRYLGDSIDIEMVEEWALEDGEKLKQLSVFLVEQLGRQELVASLRDAPSSAEEDDGNQKHLIDVLTSTDLASLGQAVDAAGVAQHVYASNPQAFRGAMAADPTGHDVVALERRKEVVKEFRRLLDDEEFFASRLGEATTRGREAIWQAFLEQNPWILGIGLAGQLFTSWNAERLEQSIFGASILGAGKRVDAVLRTVGVIRAIAFAEIKHHTTDLFDKEYRSECWSPSAELAGGVVQAQRYVEMAADRIDKRLRETDKDGVETGETTWVIRPRSFLIVGHSRELFGETGINPTKFESFELFRRNLYEPEILTFDELLARAEWTLELAMNEGEALADDQLDGG